MTGLAAVKHIDPESRVFSTVWTRLSQERGDHVVGFCEGSTQVESCRVHAVNEYFEGHSRYAWSMIMNNELENRAAKLMQEHSIDWLVANNWETVPSAISISERFDVDLYFWVQNTQKHDNSIMCEDAVEQLEKKGFQKSDAVILDIENPDAVARQYDVDRGKVWRNPEEVIP